jgi:hypothetical protein
LLHAEKELTRRSDELARRRRELPWVRIDVTPLPVLPELERSGDRMMGGVKMLRGVAVL